MQFIDPRTDFAFKKIFGSRESKDILMSFLNQLGSGIGYPQLNQVVGITIMDFVKSVIVPGRDAENVFVYEIMTKPVITIPAQMDIRYATRLMLRTGVRRAPVEDKGEIVGMITLSSLVLNNDIL